jgi:hypothetical protein
MRRDLVLVLGLSSVFVPACGKPPAEAPSEAPSAGHATRAAWSPESPEPAWWKAEPPCPDGAKMVGALPPIGHSLQCLDETGRPHGPTSIWFGNTHSGTMSEFQHGVPHGRYLYWMHNRPMVDGGYVQGRRHGAWTYHFDEASTFSGEDRLDPRYAGDYVVEHYANGLLVRTERFEDGKLRP